MTQPADDQPAADALLPDDRREDPPLPGSAWVQDHEPPRTEAERQAQETIRSLSRLEEGN
ncbi:MAG: hypothetical protein JWM62_2245 [Frankiales bacterium]|jgi:hypothetical protein|nr:hypothetical protein [Frankiales bacterium]